MKLVLLRHGESKWNLENKFTGWKDVELTEKGEKEAKNAGELIKNEKFNVDLVYTSLLKRAVNTCLLYTSPSPRDRQKSRMPSSA